MATAVLALPGMVGCGIAPSTERTVDDRARGAAPASPPTVRLTLAGIGRGDDPGITYLDGRRLVTPDGVTASLEGRRYDWVTPYSPGWLAGATAQARLVFLDAAGAVLRRQPGSRAVVDGSGSQVAYVTSAETSAESGSHRPELVLAPTIGAESAKLRIPVPAGAVPVGFLAEETVVFDVGSPAGVFVARFGRKPEKVPGLLRGASATEHGLAAGTTKLRTAGSCSAVVEVSTFRRLWETCDFSLEQFSPDGRYILATDAYRDGIGQAELSIADARTGELLVRYRKQGGDDVHVNQMVWEDDTHALASVHDGGRWALVRMDTDGRMELASDPVAGADVDCPLFFSLRP